MAFTLTIYHGEKSLQFLLVLSINRDPSDWELHFYDPDECKGPYYVHHDGDLRYELHPIVGNKNGLDVCLDQVFQLENHPVHKFLGDYTIHPNTELMQITSIQTRIELVDVDEVGFSNEFPVIQGKCYCSPSKAYIHRGEVHMTKKIVYVECPQTSLLLAIAYSR